MRKIVKISCLAEFSESDFILVFQLLTDPLLGPSFQDSGEIQTALRIDGKSICCNMKITLSLFCFSCSPSVK